MNKPVKVIGLTLGVLVVLVIAVAALLPMVINLNEMVADSLKEDTGRDVTVDSVEFSLLGGLDLDMKGLVVAEDPAFGTRPMIKMDRARVHVSILPLLTGMLVVDLVDVQGLEVSVVRGPDGRLNLDTLPRKDEAAAKGEASPQQPETPAAPKESDDEGGMQIIVANASLTGGVLHLTNMQTKAESSIPLQKLHLSSKAQGEDFFIDLELVAPGLSLQANGKPLEGDGPEKSRSFTLQAKLEAGELAERLKVVWPQLQLAGQGGFKLEVTGPPTATRLALDATVTGLRLPMPGGAGPMRIDDMTAGLDMTLDQAAETLTLQKFSLVSSSLKTNAQGSGVFGWGKAMAKTNASFSKTADLGKLALLCPHMKKAGIDLSGELRADLKLQGSDQGVSLHAEATVADLSYRREPMPCALRDKKVQLSYDIMLTPAGKAEIKSLRLASHLADINITGTVDTSADKPTYAFKVMADPIRLTRKEYQALVCAVPQLDTPMTGLEGEFVASGDVKAAASGKPVGDFNLTSKGEFTVWFDFLQSLGGTEGQVAQAVLGLLERRENQSLEAKHTFGGMRADLVLGEQYMNYDFNLLPAPESDKTGRLKGRTRLSDRQMEAILRISGLDLGAVGKVLAPGGDLKVRVEGTRGNLKVLPDPTAKLD